MALSTSKTDRDFNKYRDAGSNNTKVAVTQEGDTGLIEGIQYDDVQASYPSSLIEEYAYFLNTVLQATVEITYQDSCKRILLRARRI